MKQAQRLSALSLLERCDGLLLDSYGVLVNSQGLLEGAQTFIEELQRRDFPFVVLTNDASRRPDTISQWYASLGLHIPGERIISSGLLVADYLAEHDLRGVKAAVLGPPDSLTLVAQAGAQVVPIDGADAEVQVVVLCDEAGYPFLPSLDRILTLVAQRYRAGKRTHLLLPNPDRVYPSGPSALGVGAGSVGAALESALSAAFPGQDAPSFTRLGKPHAPIFERGKKALGAGRLVMIGDQLETDIAGAMEAGLGAALVGTGVLDLDATTLSPMPDFLLPSLA